MCPAWNAVGTVDIGPSDAFISDFFDEEEEIERT